MEVGGLCKTNVIFLQFHWILACEIDKMMQPQTWATKYPCISDLRGTQTAAGKSVEHVL